MPTEVVASPVSPGATPGKLHKRNSTGVGADADLPWTPSADALKKFQALTKTEASDVESIQRSFCNHAVKTLARSSFNMDNFAAFQALAHSIRDRLLDRWNATQQYHTAKDPKRVYYMSLEFLLGRTLDNALGNLGVKDATNRAMTELGFRLEDLIEEEVDAALGNGGLGRLAACFIDSMATLDYPAWGYGLRYQYGIFQQKIIDGYQNEFPDYWLNFGNAWEIERLDVSYEVRFGGHMSSTMQTVGDKTVRKYTWEGGEKVVAVAYDYPIPGCNTNTCINIRLWSSKPKKEFDFASFNDGNYDKSVEEQKSAENITSVLYPNDNHMVGKILRLKQQYFFCSATLQDVIRRFKKSGRTDWKEFPDQVSIQLNDTHPTLSIVELQRILVDEQGIDWDDAWSIVTRVFSFTNHTVLPEALEKWTVPLIQQLLPRHMSIIFDINLFFLQAVEKRFPGDRDLLARMSIIEEGAPQIVRMAVLAIVGSHTVNGVAALHSSLIKNVIFKDFVTFFGEPKFTNVTNGITPRRWLHQSNPRLSTLITSKLGVGEAWLKDLSLLKGLEKFADDKVFQQEWMAIKRLNKIRLAEHIKTHVGITVNPDAIFDIQCKRLHEYKRQFMNILGVIHQYLELKTKSKDELAKQVPRVVIFAGKSAPGYYIAKLVIKLINSVADVVNNDKSVNDLLKVVFIPNYNVSVAEIMIPASDLSQHISTAGTEASGTSNMKFVLNGGLILGTVDGANIEIGEQVGKENIWFFGALTPEVEDLRHAQRYRGPPMDASLAKVLDWIKSGSCGDSHVFDPLIATLTTGGDVYLISHDFAPYLQTQRLVEAAFRDTTGWARRTIRASAKMGHFSSDRSIREYAERIWKIKPLPVVMPSGGEPATRK